MSSTMMINILNINIDYNYHLQKNIEFDNSFTILHLFSYILCII